MHEIRGGNMKIPWFNQSVAKYAQRDMKGEKTMGWMRGMLRQFREPKEEIYDLVLKPEIKRINGKSYVSFKAGTSRLYVIYNLTHFIKMYARKRTITLGTKTEVDLGIHRIKQESRPLFDFVYQEVCKAMDQRVPPQKYLELSGERMRNLRALCSKQADYFFYVDREGERIVCKPEIRYGENKKIWLDELKENGTYDVFRDLERENEVLEQVRQWFPEKDPEKKVWFCEESAETVEGLQEEGLEILKTLGEVHVTEQFRNIKVRKAKKLQMGVSIQGNLLELQVSQEGMDPEEWLQILEQYEPKKKYYRLADGEYVTVEEEDVNTLRAMLEELDVSCKDFVSGKMHIPVYRALYLEHRLKENKSVEMKKDEAFRHLISHMTAPEESSFVIPQALDVIMRTYQKEGFVWLKTLAHYGFDGILADDMGLGKTLQVIALLLSEKERGADGTTLIVVPASLTYNWKAEFMKFAPDMKVSLVIGKRQERAEIIQNYRESDVLITSYDLIKRDIAEYEGAEFYYQILDEAQYIKNHGTATAKTVKLIHSQKRLALTGTPIENRLSELWSIFDFLMPGFLHSYETFRSKWERKIVSQNDADRAEQLRKLVAPFILRRKKEDVLKDLPEKLEEICYVRLEKEQQKLYDAGVMELRNTLEAINEEEFQRERIGILAALTKLRQTCCGPELLYQNYKGDSAKRRACMELVKSAKESGHKLLLFSQFTSVLTLLEQDLEKEKISYYRIDGATPKKKRLDLVNAFNEDDTPVFLISLKAGGTGLNLTGADVVIHYDPWWNQAVTNQATDRAHRFGQTRPVSVYKLVAKDTIEEKIISLQEKKQDLAESILCGETVSIGQMKKEEILALFQ